MKQLHGRNLRVLYHYYFLVRGNVNQRGREQKYCTRTSQSTYRQLKPEDTFRADNRTRNASTMPRKA